MATPDKFLEAELRLVKERSRLGVPVFNIINELQSRFDIRRSFKEVVSMQEMAKNSNDEPAPPEEIAPRPQPEVRKTVMTPEIPAEKKPRVREAVIRPAPALKAAVDVQPPKKPRPEPVRAIRDVAEPSDHSRPLSAAGAKRVAVRPASVLRQAAMANEADEAAVKQKPEPMSIKIDFTPVYVTKCTPGKSYIVKGVGAMECADVSTQTIAGFEMELVKLVEIHGGSTPMVKQIQASKFPKETIREPASHEVIDQVLHKLEFGLSSLKREARKGTAAADFLEKPIQSANIDDVADVLCFTHGHSKSKGARTQTDVAYGEKAMKIIASECAVVMGIDYKSALRRVSDAIGITAREAAPAPAVPQTPHL